MRGQANEGAVQNQFAVAGRFLQGDNENRRRQPRLQHEPQFFPANALQVGVFGVIGERAASKRLEVKIRQRSGETAIFDAS